MKHPIAEFLDTNAKTLAHNCVGSGGPNCSCDYCVAVRTTLVRILIEDTPSPAPSPGTA